MKKLTVLLGLALAMVGCKSDETTNQDPTVESGSISFALSATEETYVVETKTSESDVPSLSEFSVDIIDQSGVSQVSYSSYTDMPDLVTVEAGTYTIEAKNGSLLSAGFDSPWYYGSTTAAVTVAQITSAQVECKISNVKLTIEYTDTFLSTLSDVEVTVSSVYDNSDAASPKAGVLSYDVEETRAGWFAEPYNGVISIYIAAVNARTGENVSLSTSISDVEARQWRKVNLDVKTSGDITLDIIIDETILEMPETTITVPDDNDIIDNNGDNGSWDDPNPDPEPEPDPEPDPEPETGDSPTIEGSAFGTESSSVAYDIDEVVNFNLSEDTILDILIKSEAEGGIGNLFLTIESDVLTEFLESDMLQIYGEIDLANPDTEAAWYEMFQDSMIGIIDPDEPIAGKQEHIFSVGPLMSLLGILPGASGASHYFHLRVVDANGETQKTLTIALSGEVA